MLRAILSRNDGGRVRNLHYLYAVKVVHVCRVPHDLHTSLVDVVSVRHAIIIARFTAYTWMCALKQKQIQVYTL